MTMRRPMTGSCWLKVSIIHVIFLSPPIHPHPFPLLSVKDQKSQSHSPSYGLVYMKIITNYDNEWTNDWKWWVEFLRTFIYLFILILFPFPSECERPKVIPNPTPLLQIMTMNGPMQWLEVVGFPISAFPFILIFILFPFWVRKTKSHSQSHSPPDRQFNQRGVAEP